MKTIQSSFAKTHFAQLLDEVEKGESYSVTRHGKVVARIVGTGGAEAGRLARRAAFERVAAFRTNSQISGLSVEDILSARDEGRK